MERFDVVLVQPNSLLQQRGTLIANGDSLTFEGKKGTLHMQKVRSVVSEGGPGKGMRRVAVEYGEGDTYRSVGFIVTGPRTRSATRGLEERIRGALQMAPISQEERAGYERSVAARKTASGKQGRLQMVIGGLLAVIGVVVTAVTYSNASSSSSGGTYLLLWGPIVLGAILFFQGLASSRASRR